jgi:hypothetical protein
LSTPAPEWGTIVEPDELEELLGLSAEDAQRVSTLVQIAVEAYCWPNVIEAPIPAPVHAVGLELAAMFGGAALTKAGAVVGETIGGYSYRLATPLTLDSVLGALDGALGRQLNPWAPMHSTAFDLDTSPIAGCGWPPEWWQRDLDRLSEELALA